MNRNIYILLLLSLSYGDTPPIDRYQNQTSSDFTPILLEVVDATGLWENMPAPNRQTSNLVIPYDGPGWNGSWLTFSTIFEIGAQGQGLWTGYNYIAEGSTTEESVYFDLGFPQTITEIRLYNGYTNSERFPKRMQLMQGGTYGDDSGDWTEIGSEVTLDVSDLPTTYPDYYSFDISETPFSGQYFRLRFRGNFSGEIVTNGNSGKIELAAVQFYGTDSVECGAELADVTGDGEINVLDLVQISYYVLELSTPTYLCAADYNGDDQVNILDLVMISNFILYN